MVLETLVSLDQLTRLMARDEFINFSGCDSSS
jgi:hypothetical protein